jgi:hypothetical protein
MQDKNKNKIEAREKCVTSNLLREETQVKSSTAILRICKEKIWFIIDISSLI